MKLVGLGCAAVLGLALINCDGKTVGPGGGAGGDGAPAATTGQASTAEPWTFVPPTGVPVMMTASKVDILLAVDNSLGMAGKSEVLAQSLKGYLDAVAAKTSDIHLGIVTSSLGSPGANAVPDDGVCPEGVGDNDTHAYLQRGDGAANGVLAMGIPSDLPAFEANAAKLVRAVGQNGCGFEAQLESMYRFLVQPDPWDTVVVDEFAQADEGDGVDSNVLADRKAFLRPDSLLVVLMLTDEDDSTPDPLAIGGFGYAFGARNFPGSKVERGSTAQGTTAPRGTAICDTDPANVSCTSCGFGANCDETTATCQALRNDPNCTVSDDGGNTGEGFDGFYGPADDDLNVRFFHMKERFGVDPQFPLDRYVAGFNSSAVPDRAGEHAITAAADGQREIADYAHHNTCTNPIFAANLPSSKSDELCKLARGPRTPDFVMFGILTGVPTDLGDAAAPSWTAILGADESTFDYTGIDPRMVQSTTTRVGVATDWDTQAKDLEYACTFARATPLDCSGSTPECACGPNVTAPNAALCSSTEPTQQVLDKAFPATRELRLAQAMGDRGIIGSICHPATESYSGFLGRFAAATTAKLTP